MFGKKSQPKFQFGTELELFTLDKNGAMANNGPKLISKIRNSYVGIHIQKEIGKNMIEINSDPETVVANALENVIEQLEYILYAAEKENIILYPYGTYPGRFTPEIHNDKKYKIKQNILGKNKVASSARCIGVHCHYTLPWSIFDETEILIRGLVPSRKKHTLVNIYNFFIAMDPALTTFAQSSPFYQGERLGKDARMIVYRGGKVLRYPKGVYGNYQEFGALPNYKARAEDLLELAKARFDYWNSLTKKFGVNVKTLIQHGSLLETAWNPVKINPHGTMEYRGMDANNPSLIVAVGIIIKWCAKMIQDEKLQVIVTKDAIKEPFKRKGNSVYVPPHEYVYKILQYKSAYFGLEDNTIYNYCSNLYEFARKAVPKDRAPLLNPIIEMLNQKKTTSDEIIKKAKLVGYKKGKPLTNAQASQLALILSRDLHKDILTTKQHLKLLKG